MFKNENLYRACGEEKLELHGLTTQTDSQLS